MASQLKHSIAKTVIRLFLKCRNPKFLRHPTFILYLEPISFQVYKIWQNKINTRSYGEFFECFSLKQKQENKVIWRIQLPLKEREKFDEVLFRNTQEELLESGSVKSVTLNENIEGLVYVEINDKDFTQDVLESQPTSLNYEKPPKKVIVEFSSPNIAKHFHVGHLRSTMIGNCLANIKRKLGDDVVKINYLGDWGTQLGLLQVGLNLQNLSEEDFKDDPLKVLLNAYVKGNKEAEKDSSFYDEARKIFSDLESGDKEKTQLWNKYRDWTLKGLNNMYNRLGVSFDEFEWESDYNRKKADPVLEMLEGKGILQVDKLGRKVAATGHKELPLIKSDDTTLYLMRDLCALINRKSKHKFDEMYYIVDNGQSEHFSALKALSSKLKINENSNIEHVKFGRIHGLSTRKGKFTPLSDVLDEARDRIFEVQRRSENTKILLDNKETADILGVTSLIINDLKRRRIKDYEFSWEDTIKATEGSGVLLQYTHCRLHNLLQENNVDLATECDPYVLLEPEVLNLVHEMAKYEEKLLDSNAKHEPCTLTTYLFDLVKAINLAYLRLKVKRSDAHTAQQRNLLFHKSKEVLNEGMRILGLKPLEKM